MVLVLVGSSVNISMKLFVFKEWVLILGPSERLTCSGCYWSLNERIASFQEKEKACNFHLGV